MSLNTRILIRIAVVLLVTATVLASLYFFVLRPKLRYLSAVSLTADITYAAAVYGQDYGKLPEMDRIVEILRGDNVEELDYLPQVPDSLIEGNSIIDPWGRLLEITLAIRPEGSVAMARSAGPDGLFETEDDIDDTHFAKVMSEGGGTRESDEVAPKKPVMKPSAG